MQFESSAGGADATPYTAPNQALGIQGGIVPKAAIENHQYELLHLIEESGLVPDRGDLTQVLQAIDARIAAAVAAATLVAPGTLRVSAGSNPGPGEFLCNGQELLRATYPDLFLELGEGLIWGEGNGTTTFNVPNLQGRGLMVAGLGVGLTARTLGQLLGEETHTLALEEMTPHSHDVLRELSDSDGTAGAGNGHLVGDGNESNGVVTITGDSERAVQFTGEGEPFNVIGPMAVINVFIHV